MRRLILGASRLSLSSRILRSERRCHIGIQRGASGHASIGFRKTTR